MFLLLLGTAAATFVPVSFYPAVEGFLAAGTSAIHVAPLTSNQDFYLDVTSSFCSTYNVTIDSQFTGIGVPDHAVEVFCIAEATCATSGYADNCSIQQLFNVSTGQNFFTRRPQVFSFFACDLLPPNWYTAPSCDTQMSSQSVQNCAVRNEAERQFDLSPCDAQACCKPCAWDCSFGMYCYLSQGLPPLPIFQLGIPPLIPCTDGSFCNYYCCTTIERNQSALQEVDVTTRCVFVPTAIPGTPACTHGDHMTETCTASASWNSSTRSLNTATVTNYTCSYSCGYPCATSPVVPLSECQSADRMSNCLPGTAHDKHCTINILADTKTVCPTGGIPVVYKNVDKVQAAGQNPFVPLTVGLYPGLVAQCSPTDDIDCDPPVCKCLGPHGCPNHPTCSGRGTLFESDLPWVQAACVCNPDGSFGDLCEFAPPDSNIDCSNGQQITGTTALYLA